MFAAQVPLFALKLRELEIGKGIASYATLGHPHFRSSIICHLSVTDSASAFSNDISVCCAIACVTVFVLLLLSKYKQPSPCLLSGHDVTPVDDFMILE